MASRQMKMPVKNDAEKSPEADDVFSQSQRRRPELGRYLLQVDRQTILPNIECRSIGGFGDQDGSSGRSGVGVRRRRKYQHNRGSTGHAEHVTSGGGHYRAS